MDRRNVPARIGIALLNVLAPGLGLLRLGRWKLALALYLVATVVTTLLTAGPPLSFPVFGTIAVAVLMVYPVAIGLSWHFSRNKTEQLPWYGRWYVVVAAFLAAFSISYVLTGEDRLTYRSFYMPAESMAPTLPKNDRLFAYMRAPKTLKRGDLILVRTGHGDIYIKRVAALPGDRIGMINGFVTIDGSPVQQRQVGTDLIDDAFGKARARRLAEQFPGESKPHEIYDLGESPFDNMTSTRVLSGHVFVLGDNRDRSADSRVSREEAGLEQVAFADIVGRPLFFSWGSSRPLGTPVPPNER